MRTRKRDTALKAHCCTPWVSTTTTQGSQTHSDCTLAGIPALRSMIQTTALCFCKHKRQVSVALCVKPSHTNYAKLNFQHSRCKTTDGLIPCLVVLQHSIRSDSVTHSAKIFPETLCVRLSRATLLYAMWPTTA